MLRALRVIGRLLGFVVTQLLTWAICVAGIYVLGMSRQTTTVTDGVPKAFPVVVVWRGANSTEYAATVVWHEDVPSFRAAHAESTFLVPEADEARLRELVGREPETGGIRAAFQVERVANDVQKLRVNAFEGPDLHNTAWYEARRDTIAGLRHRRYFGPSLGFAAVIAGVPLSFLVNGAAWFFVVRWRRRGR